MTNLYEVANLKCRYPKSDRIVLEIEELNIPKGEIVFFIGASGVGKSTILETLGLMNNTIVESSSTKFLFRGENEEVDFMRIWHRGDKALSLFRRKYLSFIFQQTNLFPYLTVHQNANIIQIIQGNNYMHSNQKTKRVFNELALRFGKEQSPKVTNISGGQRQRVAFARAISTSYEVIFADEPTGNLDWYNADNLMGILKETVSKAKKTAIIVSHDISLALKYATRIVLIDKRRDLTMGNIYGYVGKEQIFINMTSGSSWTNGSRYMTEADLETMLKEKIMEQSEMFTSKNK
jgi:putative ABC transport system ATP-binding protein